MDIGFYNIFPQYFLQNTVRLVHGVILLIYIFAVFMHLSVCLNSLHDFNVLFLNGKDMSKMNKDHLGQLNGLNHHHYNII